MIDQVELLTTTSADANNVINQLPVTDASRDFFLDSLNETNAKASSGIQSLRTGTVYAAIIVISTGLAILLMSMMGRQ
jgi:hypothetical protein